MLCTICNTPLRPIKNEFQGRKKHKKCHFASDITLKQHEEIKKKIMYEATHLDSQTQQELNALNI